MIMKIFEHLENPVQFQILNKRFYNGIHPNWFSQIKGTTLKVRLTEDEGVSHEDFTDFEYPTQDYIEGLTLAQKRSLHISGISQSTDGDLYDRVNIFVSTGEQSKIADWEDQTVTMIEQQSKVAKIRLHYENSRIY